MAALGRFCGVLPYTPRSLGPRLGSWPRALELLGEGRTTAIPVVCWPANWRQEGAGQPAPVSGDLPHDQVDMLSLVAGGANSTTRLQDGRNRGPRGYPGAELPGLINRDGTGFETAAPRPERSALTKLPPTSRWEGGLGRSIQRSPYI